MRDESLPQVCVVIPVYNAEDWISRTIQSVLEQDYANVAVIAVDDGSTDNSVEEVRAFGQKVRLKTGPNRGACHARNQGLAIASEAGADYVIFLDADDYLEGEMIAGSVLEANRNKADMVLSNMHLEYPDGTREIRQRYQGQVAPETFYEGWMRGDYVNPSGILWSVEFVNSIGGWDESLARAQDLEITLRALLASPVIWKNEDGAAIHARVNPNSISNKQSEKALSSRYHAVSGLVEKAQGTSFEKYNDLMYREIYHIASAAFRADFTDLGRILVTYLKDRDYSKHPGSRLHSIAASLIGLENKVRLRKGR